MVDRGYEEDRRIDPKVAEYLHISEVFEHAAEFDLIHSHYDFMALSYTRLVKTPVLTTIHGFSSPQIMPVYQKYRDGYFVSISDSDRAPGLNYLATVYNGIDLSLYPLRENRRRRPDLSSAGFIRTRVSIWRSRLPAKRAADCSSPASSRIKLLPRAGGAAPRMTTRSATSGRWTWRARMRCSQGLRAAAPEYDPGAIRPGAGGSQCRGRAGDRDGSRLLP